MLSFMPQTNLCECPEMMPSMPSTRLSPSVPASVKMIFPSLVSVPMWARRIWMSALSCSCSAICAATGTGSAKSRSLTISGRAAVLVSWVLSPMNAMRAGVPLRRVSCLMA